MATSPDLPPPITPDLPDPPDPADFPVEPDRGISRPLRVERRMTSAFWTLRFMANRQYMGAAGYRWPLAKTSAWIF